MSQIEEILLPDVGGEEVEIIEICVSNGESIEEEDAIITVETEKASMDIPAIFAGSIVELKVSVGDKVSFGSVLCTMSKAVAAAPATVETIVESAPVETPVVEAIIETPTATHKEEQVATVIEDVFVPDIGEDGEVDVIEVLAAIGDSISEEDGLLTLETDKATMDVPAPFDGVIKEFFIEVGSKVKTGTLVARIEKTIVVDVKVSDAPIVTAAKVEAVAPSVAKTVSTPVVVASNEPSNIKTSAHASPSIRRLAREFGVDLAKVDASGRKNRILKDDVKAYVKKALANPSVTAPASTGGFGFNLPALKAIDFSKFGEIETIELTKIQKISGPSLTRNWVSIPHVTQFDEADITELEAFRKEQNALALKKKLDIKISPLIFILKAVAKALEELPRFNSSLSEDEQSIILKKYVNIAVAVDTPNGLVVPVIKDVNKKGIHELARELAIISQKARDGKLKITDMQGACFTISSLGGIGGTAFTPIVNAPEVGILGVSKSSMKPVWNGSEFEPKLMLPLSLSYDHRVVDGAYGAKFAATIANILSDIRLLSI